MTCNRRVERKKRENSEASNEMRRDQKDDEYMNGRSPCRVVKLVKEWNGAISRLVIYIKLSKILCISATLFLFYKDASLLCLY